ncbi:MAG: PAS domain S-box protein, partial [bacterium]|nr:PAS domain S-box protein [bacterium]
SGFDRDDIVGKHCFEISHGYDKPCDKYGNECYIKEVFKTGTPYHCQHEHTHENGKKKHVDVLFSPILDEKGEITHVIEAIRDISELMDTQTALSQSEEKFRTLTGNLNVGVFRTTPGKEGRFLEANPALVKMFGFDNREEMMKVNIADYYDDPKERAVFSRKATRKGRVDNEVFLFKKKNGETIVGSISALAIKDENGKTTHFDGIIEDITDRKNAELQLKWDLNVIKAMAEISSRLIREIKSIEDITKLVLKHSRQVTNSKHGYVSMIDPENGDNIGYTLTEMMKNVCKLKPEDQLIRFPIGPDGKYPKLWGYGLNTKNSFYTNEPLKHKASGGIPEGHVSLENFLSVPVMIGNELVGQIAIANSEKGFSDDDLAAVERIAELYAIAIQNIRIEEARQNSEQRYRAIYENTGIGMGILDKSGKLLDFNAIFAELFKFNSKSK